VHVVRSLYAGTHDRTLHGWNDSKVWTAADEWVKPVHSRTVSRRDFCGLYRGWCAAIACAGGFPPRWGRRGPFRPSRAGPPSPSRSRASNVCAPRCKNLRQMGLMQAPTHLDSVARAGKIRELESPRMTPSVMAACRSGGCLLSTASCKCKRSSEARGFVGALDNHKTPRSGRS